MPEGLEGTILCIEMEDHYLRVHTNRGQGMMLGRLRDAEQELGEAGMKVHRSWWVARTAITGSERDGRNLALTLTNGQQVPVSRANQPMIAEAGWLED
jgi:DNA-binding LytR/AlgR family response regulator